MLGNFFKPTKAKIVYAVLITVAILVSLGLSDNGIRCIKAPCGPSGSKIAQSVYSITTFDLKWINPNLSYTNTALAVKLKNFFRDSVGFSAGTTYGLTALIVGLVIHYLIACVVAFIYQQRKSS